MKIVFMGTMSFAVPILHALNESDEVVLVVTQPDRPAGRKQELRASPVKEYALRHDLPVFQPEKIRRDYLPIVSAQPHLIVVAAYGQMIPKAVLDLPPFGSINVHASLLPKYRGGAPMQRAIMAGDEETGVTVMRMAEKMDAGDLISQASLPILPSDDVESLEAKLADLGASLLMTVLPAVFAGTAASFPQDETKVTFARNLAPEEEALDFRKTMRQVFDHVRAFRPAPGTSVRLEGRRYKIWEVAMRPELEVPPESVPGEIVSLAKDEIRVRVSDGIVGIRLLQPEGKKAMDARAFLNGAGKELVHPGKNFNLP